jgi:hypothetical protein
MLTAPTRLSSGLLLKTPAQKPVVRVLFAFVAMVEAVNRLWIVITWVASRSCAVLKMAFPKTCVLWYPVGKNFCPATPKEREQA